MVETQAKLRQIVDSISSRQLIGKEQAVELSLLALICGGHVLIEDAPGLGKTTLAISLAQSLGCSFGRIQFTPDLLPSDITGFTMYDIASGQKILCEGGIMRQIVLADEINRTSPKTQSALLEAMQEQQVTVDGQTLMLPRPFMVLATQNPLEFAGTYPLPEAQMDRFFLRISLGYPSEAEEISILGLHQTVREQQLAPILTAEDVLDMQQQVLDVQVAQPVKQYVAQIAAASRQHNEIELPLSPRASIALMRAAMGRALFLGRDYALPDDVQYAAVPVLAHRLGLSAAARARKRTAEDIVREIITGLPVPASA